MPFLCSAWGKELTFSGPKINRRQQLLERERGFFGIGANWEKVRSRLPASRASGAGADSSHNAQVKEITDARLEHCERLTAMGYNVRID